MKRLIIPSLVAVLFLLSACGPGLILGAGGTVGVILGLDNGDDDKKDDPPPPTTNVAPAVVVTSVTREESPCSINYTIIDANADLCTVEVEYDAGSGFSATAAGAGGDGLTGLASSAGGTAHVFSWDYLTDEGPSANANVSVRIRADDGQGFGSWFTLGSQSIGNDAPTITNVVTTGSGNIVLVTFDFSDVNSDVGFVNTAYSINQGASFTEIQASEFVGNPPNSIASSPAGSPGQFIWDSSQAPALPEYVDEVWLRLTPGDQPSGFSSSTLGAPIDVGPASVDNSVNGPPEADFVTVLDAATFTGEVKVDFELVDDESDASSLAVEYSEDGTNWFAATLHRQIATGVVGPFFTSPSPSLYSFVWDALADAGDSAAHTVKLRIAGSDGQAGTVVESDWFTIIGNSAPSVTAIDIFQNSGNITINFDVLDENFDPVSMAVGYSLNGGSAFVPVVDWVFGDPTDVDSSPIGQSNVLIWDTFLTLGTANHTGVILRAIPTDAPLSLPTAGLTGTAFDSSPFPIINDAAGSDPIDVAIFTAGDGNGSAAADSVDKLTVPLGGSIGLGANVVPTNATEQDCFWEIWDGAGYGTLSIHSGSTNTPTLATGSFTIADYTQLVDGDTITMDGGLFSAITFEFDDNSMSTGANNAVVQISTTSNDDQAALMAAAINSQVFLSISASSSGNVVNLIHQIYCDLSNNTNSAVPEANAVPMVFNGSAAALNAIVDMDGGTGDEFIKYTAPSTIPGGASTVTIRCSVDNPAFFSTVYQEYVLYFGDEPTSVSIISSATTVLLNDTEQFTAMVQPYPTAPQNVTWVVVGGAANGLINESGLYTAPSGMPGNPSVTIEAFSVAGGISPGSFTIILIPEPSSILVSPTTTNITEIDVGNQTELFSAAVNPGTAPQTVTWRIFWNNNDMGSGDLGTVGTVDASGLYTSPNTLPIPDIIWVEAVSTVRPAVFGSYPLIIKALVPTDFTLSPANATVTAGGAGQQFTVSNFDPIGANEAVSWSIDAGGLGSVNATGFYTPPATVGTTISVTLRATSVVTALSRTSMITVNLATGSLPLGIVLSPSSGLTFSSGNDIQFTYVVNPSGASQAVTWTIEAGIGTIDSAGKYTPAATTIDDEVTIRCASVGTPTVFSESTIKVDGSGYSAISKSNLGLEVTQHDSLLYYESSSGTEQIWHVGGISKFTGNEYDLTVMVHDINADTWTEAPPVGYHTSSNTQNITQDAESLSSVISDGGRIYSVVGFANSTEVWSYAVTQGYTGDWALESTSSTTFPGRHHPLMIYPAAGAGGTPMTERWLMLVDGNKDVFSFVIATGNWLSKQPITNNNNAPDRPDRCGWVHAKDSSAPRFFFVGTDDSTPVNGVWHIRMTDQGASPPALQWRSYSSSGEPSSALRNPAVTWRKTTAVTGELVVFGGEDTIAGDHKQEGWEIQYDTVGANSASWSLRVPSFLEPSPTGPEITYPAARRGATLTINAFDDEVYLYGGDSGVGKFGDYWGFSYPGNFTPLPLAIQGLEPAGRTYAAATIDAGGTIWVYGGSTDAGISDEFWKLENYDPDTGDGDWSLVHASAPVIGEMPPGLWGASLEYDATNDIIYLFGGGLDSTGGAYNNDVYQFRVSVGEWTLHQPTSGPAPSAGRATYFDANSDRIFSFGGSDSGGSNMYNDFFVLNVSAATPVWVTVASTSTPPGREFATLGYDAVADKIYLLGGFDGSTGQTQMFVYRFATNSWQQQTVTVPLPLAPEDVHSSGGVWDSEHLRFFNTPSITKKFQSVTIVTGGASWHDLISPATNNTTNSVGVYDSTSGYYICLFGRRQIKGIPTGTNIVKSFKVK